MANEEKVKIAYAMRPILDDNGAIIGYKKFHPVTTGNAVVVKVGEERKVLNQVLYSIKTKLDGLSNYDDTELREAITSINNALDALIGTEDVTEAIDTMNEVIAFLNTFKNKKNLAAVLAALETSIQEWVEAKNYLTEQVQPDWNATSGKGAILNKPTNATESKDGFMSKDDKKKLNDLSSEVDDLKSGKQDNIDDLADIRSGAEAGARSVQPEDIADMETMQHASQVYQIGLGLYIDADGDICQD